MAAKRKGGGIGQGLESVRRSTRLKELGRRGLAPTKGGGSVAVSARGSVQKLLDRIKAAKTDRQAMMAAQDAAAKIDRFQQERESKEVRRGRK